MHYTAHLCFSERRSQPLRRTYENLWN